MGRQFEHVVEGSFLWSLVVAVRSSALVTALRAAMEWVVSATRNAFIYRWLTKEPEPDVIVIDLRETWTVGPLIVLLDWFIERLTPYWRASVVRQAGVALGGFVERALATRPGRFLKRLLTPPEPPDSSDGDKSESSPSSRG